MPEHRPSGPEAVAKHPERFAGEFQKLLDGIPDVLTLLDRELRILWINQAGRTLLGRTAKVLEGSHCFTSLKGRSGPCDGCPALASFESTVTEENLISDQSGTIWGVKAFPLTGSEQGRVENVITLSSDITEKIKLRTEAVRASQLATLGELAAGVAHEINNPINAIINYAQLLLDRNPEETSDNRVLAGEILEEGSRIAETVRNLLSFAQKRDEERRPVRVGEILSACLDLTGSQLKKEGIRVDLDLEESLPPLLVENQPIQQVILNLISNARYALNQKYPPHHPRKSLRIEGREDPERSLVLLSFTDFGIGIPSHLVGRVMDPFFSTKPSDQGTGLGLSISRGIVKHQGGDIIITSREGEFTSVVLELPVKGDQDPS